METTLSKAPEPMDDLKIILFICNWGAHPAYQALQDRAAPIPREIRMIRVPCTGRVNKALLFKAFEMGAEGVAVVGCRSGACRYGEGSSIAERNVDHVREVLDLLGLGRERLEFETILPEETDELLGYLRKFRDQVAKAGPSPVLPRMKPAPAEIGRAATARILTTHDIYACQDCGKCSSACPLSLSGKPFSPRALANAVIGGAAEAPDVVEDVWTCLTCGLCYDRCPSAVNFPNFIRDMREAQKSLGTGNFEAHGGFFQALMRAMTSPGLKLRRWRDLPEDLQVDPAGKTLFFGGCAPYFDRHFKHHLGVRTEDILHDGIRLLNFFDIHPAVMEDERCCGHDLLWTGDKENFARLARLNAEAMADMGIERVVTACPECYRTLSKDWAEAGVSVPFQVTHLHDLIEREVSKGAVAFRKFGRAITFQDPCRLARMSDCADVPRKLIKRLKTQGFTEMRDRGASALCCGNCAWTGCDTHTKALQVKRLRQARETGSDLLVTACPKCQIHLTCAMQDPVSGAELGMEIMDLTSLMAKTIHWE